MHSVGVRELREQLSQILQRVRKDGEVVEITYYGQVIARLVPVTPAQPSDEEMKAILTDMDDLAAEIGRQWKGEQRRCRCFVPKFTTLTFWARNIRLFLG